MNKDLGRVPDGTRLSRAEPQSTQGLGPSDFDPSRKIAARCIEIAHAVRDGFLSPEYATNQPISSLMERFACDQVAEAIKSEFGLGTIEQRVEIGWLIERGNVPLYATTSATGKATWTALHDDALRFAREADAYRAMGLWSDADRVAEHRWG